MTKKGAVWTADSHESVLNNTRTLLTASTSYYCGKHRIIFRRLQELQLSQYTLFVVMNSHVSTIHPFKNAPGKIL